MRTYLTARAGLVEASTALNAQIRGLLRAHGIRLGKVAERDFESRVRTLIGERVPTLAAALTPLLALWRQAIDAVATLNKVIAERAKQDTVCRRFMSAPGYRGVDGGGLSGHDRRSLALSALGLAPSVYQSGDIDYRGRITKESDGLLRWLLVEAAHNLLSHTRRDCALKRWDEKLAAQKGAGKARVAVARKLAIILHRLWMTGETFDWQRA